LLTKKTPENREESQAEKVTTDVTEPQFISIDLVKDNWTKIIEQIKTKHVALSVFISEGIPTAVSDNIIELTFPKENDFHVNTVSKNRVIIEKIITQVIGLSVRLKCVKGELTKNTTASPPLEPATTAEPAPRIEVVKPEKQQAILDEIIELFDGEYVS
jgi:hypothetical protein